LFLLDLDKPMVTPSNGIIAKGSNTSFSCFASSWPNDLSYTWVSHKHIVVSRQPILTISDASWDMSGEYQCIVNNTILTRIRLVHLKIECKGIYTIFSFFI